jgi:hypothetical protein
MERAKDSYYELLREYTSVVDLLIKGLEADGLLERYRHDGSLLALSELMAMDDLPTWNEKMNVLYGNELNRYENSQIAWERQIESLNAKIYLLSEKLVPMTAGRGALDSERIALAMKFMDIDELGDDDEGVVPSRQQVSKYEELLDKFEKLYAKVENKD